MKGLGAVERWGEGDKEWGERKRRGRSGRREGLGEEGGDRGGRMERGRNERGRRGEGKEVGKWIGGAWRVKK